jgi:hypothetical protein
MRHVGLEDHRVALAQQLRRLPSGNNLDRALRDDEVLDRAGCVCLRVLGVIRPTRNS